MMPSFFEESIVRDTYLNDEVGVARFKRRWLGEN